MIYRVILQNGNTQTRIHDTSPDPTRKLPTGKIVRQGNSISSFSFSIYPQNVGFNLLYERQTHVVVYNILRDRFEFKGRVLKVNPSMDENGVITRQVVCEDRLGYLNDSIQPFIPMKHYTGDESRTGLEEFIDVVLDHHNSSVEPYKRIYRGNVTVNPFKSSDNVTKELNYQKTWTALHDKLVGSFGGYLVLRETDDVLYLDYLAEVGVTRTTRIELARNMKSSSRETNPNDYITRLVPLGAKISEDSEERVTIAEVNNGVEWIENAEYRQRYGIILDKRIWEDVTSPSTLKSKAETYLAESNLIFESFKITALDLSIAGVDADDFMLFDRYPTWNPLIGLDEVLQIVKQAIDIIQPLQSTFEMGDTTRRLSDAILETQAGSQGVAGKSSYTHIRYSENADGSDMVDTPNETTKYIGMAVSFSSVAPVSNRDYTWSRYVGGDGENGVGITDVIPYYSKGSSATVAPSDPSIPEWDVIAPDLKYGEYLWCAYYIKYSDGNFDWTEPFNLKSAEDITQSILAPSDPAQGMLWLDTSSKPYTLKRWDGSSWEIVADYTDSINAAYEYIDTSVAEVKKTNSELTAYVQRETVSKTTYETFYETVRTILSMDENGITTIFEDINKAITDVNNQQQTNYNEIIRYIRFENGNIILGEKGHETTLKLEKDIIGFYQNGVLVAYMSDSQLYIGNATIKAGGRLTLGDFGFVPRPDGSLAFLKVGGSA